MTKRAERAVESFLFQSRRSTEWSEDFLLGCRRSCETGSVVVLVGDEALDIARRGDSRSAKTTDQSNADTARRADALQAAAGIWRDRTDLPNFSEVRSSWDRA